MSAFQKLRDCRRSDERLRIARRTVVGRFVLSWSGVGKLRRSLKETIQTTQKLGLGIMGIDV